MNGSAIFGEHSEESHLLQLSQQMYA